MDTSEKGLVPNTFFEVQFFAPLIGLSGCFTSVTGLAMEFEYETQSEGGVPYPRHFFKNIVPQRLVLEQGTVTQIDLLAAWIHNLNIGMRLPLNGVVLLKDHTGAVKRNWMIMDALIVKYIGPSLNSMQPELAVTRIEMIHNGCI